jgi:hypothetical protein
MGEDYGHSSTASAIQFAKLRSENGSLFWIEQKQFETTNNNSLDLHVLMRLRVA